MLLGLELRYVTNVTFTDRHTEAAESSHASASVYHQSCLHVTVVVVVVVGVFQGWLNGWLVSSSKKLFLHGVHYVL